MVVPVFLSNVPASSIKPIEPPKRQPTRMAWSPSQRLQKQLYFYVSMEDDHGVVAAFPHAPYDIQKAFMLALYETLDQKQVGLFESPTGESE